MAQSECSRCNGTGYANAAKDSGLDSLPSLMQPIGVYRCPSCGGTGRVGLSDEAMALIEKLCAKRTPQPADQPTDQSLT